MTRGWPILRLALCLLTPSLSLCLFADESSRSAELVRQLGDEQYVVREAAEKELLKLGSKAFQALQAARESQDPEVLRRIERIYSVVGLLELWKFEANLTDKDWLAAGQRPLLGLKARDWPASPIKTIEGTQEFPFAEEGMTWLCGAQEGDGHWDSVKYGAEQNADLEQTALCLLSLLGAGHTEKIGRYKKQVRMGIAWLIKQQRPDGGLARPEDERVYGIPHALAGMALSEAACMGRESNTVAAAQKAIDYACNIHQCEIEDKKYGFGRSAKSQFPDTLTTAFFAMQLKSAKLAGLREWPESLAGAIKFLNRVEDKQTKAIRLTPDGGTSPFTIFAGCVARQFTGWKKEDLKELVEENHAKFGAPSTGQEGSDVLGNYFGTLVLFQQGGEEWKRWNEAMKTSLIEGQRKGGIAHGSWDPSGAWKGMGRVGATALNCLCLEVYYRYLPMYKE